MKHLATWALCAVVAVGPGCSWDGAPRTADQQAELDLKFAGLNRAIQEGLARVTTLHEQYAAGAITKADLQRELLKASVDAAKGAAANIPVPVAPTSPWALALAALPGVLAAAGAVVMGKRDATAKVIEAKQELTATARGVPVPAPIPLAPAQMTQEQWAAAMRQKPA